MKRIYLDHAATTPIHQEVVEVMMEALQEVFGNPSSTHQEGRMARDLLESSRESVARAIPGNVQPEEIIFTGSGTESDNLAIQGVAFKRRHEGKHIITSNIEHPAVRNTLNYLARDHGFKITEVPVRTDGIVDVDDLQDIITDETILISIMHANNEIGTIQPVRAIGEIAADNGIVFHTDAVQTFGKLSLDPEENGIHLFSASAHKIHGPKGTGILYMMNGGEMDGIGKYIQPVIQGGGHERGYRSATENVAGIAGMARATEIAFRTMKSEMPRQERLRDDLVKRVLGQVPGCRLNGHAILRLPGNANFSFEGIKGDALQLRLDARGFACSTGSACSSMHPEISRVLLAIGLPRELAMGSLRVSLGSGTTREELELFADALVEEVNALRTISSRKT